MALIFSAPTGTFWAGLPSEAGSPSGTARCAHLLRGPAEPRLIREESAKRVYLGRPTPARLRTASCMPNLEHVLRCR